MEKKDCRERWTSFTLYRWINGAGVMSGGQDAKVRRAVSSLFSAVAFSTEQLQQWGKGKATAARSRTGNKSIGILPHLILSPSHFPHPHMVSWLWKTGGGMGRIYPPVI